MKVPQFSDPSDSGTAVLSRKAHFLIHYLEYTLALRGEATECICISVEIFNLLLLMLPSTFPEIGTSVSCEKHLSFVALLIVLIALLAVSRHHPVAK